MVQEKTKNLLLVNIILQKLVKNLEIDKGTKSRKLSTIRADV